MTRTPGLLGRVLTATLLLGSVFSGSATAQLNNGSTGADGPFAPTSNFVVDLNSMGTYDANNWAVVFNFTTVTIPSGVTVTFSNHWSGAPVVWLCTGDVVIDGAVNLNGGNGGLLSYARGGPGGHRGGAGDAANLGYSAGFGPGGAFRSGLTGSGGGFANGGGGGAGGSPYSGPSVFPLIGGSGGSASDYGVTSPGGGGGGGAILIASDGVIVVNGGIYANGGKGHNTDDWPYNYDGGSGSGGAIRLLGETVTLSVSSAVQATGLTGTQSNGSQGRIRIEGNGPGSIVVIKAPSGSVSYSEIPGTPFPQVLPKVWVQSVVANGQTYDLTGLDPRAVITPNSSADIQIAEPAGTVTLNIQASDIDVDGAGNGPSVFVRVTYSKGNAVVYTTGPLVGTSAFSSVSQDVNLGSGVSAIQMRVVLP